jgi:hypothetical protein
MEDQEGQPAGLSRRSMLKRSAAVGGAIIWATPVVQSLASPAYAAGSNCTGTLTVGTPGQTGCTIIAYVQYTPDCCACAQPGTTCTATCLAGATLQPVPDPANPPSCA